MKEFETLKVYGKTLRTWRHNVTVERRGRKEEVERLSQKELAYTAYDSTGAKISTGSEDFSLERLGSLKHYRIFAWDGKKYNKGGARWFDEVGGATVERRNRKKLQELAQKWYPQAAAISIR